MSRKLYFIVVLAAVSWFVSCDSVLPDASDRLVIEGFFDTGRPLPTLTVSRTSSLSASRQQVGSSVVTDAQIDVLVNGVNTSYTHSGLRAGSYVPGPSAPVHLEASDVFSFEVRWRDEVARGSGVLPPRITLDSLLLEVPGSPVEAILVDSLRLDSLGIDAQTGYLYAVEATVWWQANGQDSPEDHWVQAQLKPFAEFSSLVVDFFLLPEQVFPEADAAIGTSNRRWTGLYAVPVATADAPLPPHNLRLALVRSGKDYADYALTRSSPERREPTTNLSGAIGIVTGVSVDSVVVSIDEHHAGRKTVVASNP